MEDIKSEQELYTKLLPALTTRSNEFKRNNYFYVTKEDIWNYLKESKWIKATDLSLYEIVSDILNVEYELVDYYVKEKLKHQKRDVILESSD